MFRVEFEISVLDVVVLACVVAAFAAPAALVRLIQVLSLLPH